MAKDVTYDLVSEFKGYLNKLDVTNLPPGYLIEPSQNVRSTPGNRVGNRKGFVLDGQAGTGTNGVDAAYDYEMHTGAVRHLRAGDTVLQYRYVASAGDQWDGNVFTAGEVYWIDLLTGLTSTAFNFADYWNDTTFQSNLLMVNGTGLIYRWTGGVTTILSTGTDSVEQVSITAAGSGYTAGDVLTITTGGGNATVTADTVNGSGGITAISILDVGSGYSTGAGQATSGGTGTGATVNITTVGFYIQKTGTETWAEVGFTPTTGGVTINTNDYTYNRGAGSTRIGTTTDPTGEPVQSVVHQTVTTNSIAALAGLPDTFEPDIIATLENQVYLGEFTNRFVYISKVNDYTDYTFSTPRVNGEGARITLDGNPTAFVPQEQEVYISAGLDQWYRTEFQTLGDAGKENLLVKRLKTASQQGALSQAVITKTPNDVLYISNEPTLASLGRVLGIFQTPQLTNLSDPIKNIFDSYDFTNASVFYDKFFYYLAVPAENRVLIFNVNKNYWEPPQVMSISRFSLVDGQLLGHSSETLESYQMDTGYNDNGAPIEAILALSWQQFGDRADSQRLDEVYVEGYITSNGTLSLTSRYDIDGCMQELTKTLDGGDTQFVCLIQGEGSLGKESFGKWSLGSGITPISASALPPKFRWIPTFQQIDFFEWSPVFSSIGEDFNWELLAFGPNVMPSPSQPTNIKD